MSNGLPAMTELRDRAAKRLNAINAATYGASPALAQAVAQDSEDYPWMQPDVRAAMALAGLPASVKNKIGQSTAQSAIAGGAAFAVDAARLAKAQQATAMFADQQQKAQVDEITKTVFSALRANGLGAKKFNWMSADPLRAAIRYTTAGLSAPVEMLQTSVAAPLGAMAKHGAANPMGFASAVVRGDLGGIAKDVGSAVKKAWWDDTFGAGSTTLATALESPFAAQGRGYFMGKGVAEKQAERAREVRGTTDAGHAWTLGRVAGTNVVQYGLAKDENSTAYSIVSGLGDAATAIYGDPIQLSKAARAPIEVAEVTAKAKGFGRLGNAIMDARRANRVGEIAEAGKATRVAQEAVAAGKGWEQVGVQAEREIERLTNLKPAAGGMEAAATAAMQPAALAHQESMAKYTIDASEKWFSEARKAAMQAERLGGVHEAAIDASLRGQGDYATMVRRAVGLVEDPKYGRQVAHTSTMRWLLSRDGQSVVRALTRETDPSMVMALTKSRMPVKAAVEIADAKTAEETVQALARALTVEGGARTPTRISRFGTLRIAKAQESRMLGGMSKASDAYFDIEAPEEAVDKVFNLLGTAGVLGEQRNTLVSGFMRALATDNRGAIYYATRGLQGQIDLASEIKNTTKLIEEGTLVGQELTNTQKYLADLQEAAAVVGARSGIQTAILEKVGAKNWAENLLHRDDLKILLDDPTKEYGHVSKYVAQKMLEGDPQMTKWDNGPLRVSQLTNGRIHMIDPNAVREIETEMSKLSNLLLGRNGSFRRMPVDLARGYQERIWRVPTILRPALAVRMLGEEAARAMMGGGLRGTGDIIAGFLRAGDTVDALGHAIDAPDAIRRLTKEIDKLEQVAGNEAKVAELRAQVTAAEEALADGRKALMDAKVGKGSREGQRAVFEQRLGASEDRLVATGEWASVTRTDPSELKRFHLAAADELISHAADPVYKRLVYGAPLPGDGIEATGDGLKDIETWLTKGAGREYWYEVAANRNLDPTDMSELRAWIERQRMDIDYHFKNDPVARDAILTGRLNGEALVKPDAYGRSPHGPELTKWAKEYAKAEGSPDVLRYEMTIRDLRRFSGKDPRIAAAVENYDRITTAIFATMYSNRSDALYRVPMYSRRYWAHMEELIPKLTPEEAARVVEASRGNGAVEATGVWSRIKASLGNGFVDEEQLKRIETLAAGASGTATVEDADQLAAGWAIDDVKKLFFKADRDPRYIDKAKLVFPFARAFAEVGITWGRILAQDPTGFAHTIDKTLNGLRDSGVFHQDPNGNEVFTYPMSGQLSKLITGVNAPMTGSVKSLNMIGSILPGVGPVVSVPAYFIAQHTPLPQSAISLMFPFGEPKSLQDSLVPGWIEKLRSGWNQNEAEQVYGNTYFRVVQSLQASGKYGNSPDEMRRLLDDAKGRAGLFTALRGVIQAVGPAAPMVQYMAETKQGDIVVAKLAQDYHRMQENPSEWRAQGFDSAEDYFVSKYGESATAALVSRTISNKTGATASDSFVEWRKGDGQHAWQTYPEVYGYIGPHPDDFSLNAFDQLTKSGDRTPRTANDMVAEANNRLANIRLRDFQRDQKAQVPNPTKAQQKKLDALEQQFRKELEREFPGWAGRAELSRAQVKEKAAWLEKMAADPKLSGNDTVEHLRSFYKAKQTALLAASKKGAKTLNGAKVAGIREWLIEGAESMAANDPGFAAAWNDILSKEFN